MVEGLSASCASKFGSVVVSDASKSSLMSFCMIRDPCSWVASKVEYPQEEQRPRWSRVARTRCTKSNPDATGRKRAPYGDDLAYTI